MSALTDASNKQPRAEASSWQKGQRVWYMSKTHNEEYKGRVDTW